MDATGPPSVMVERREDLTPMMSQYFELCAEYDDSLVLFQVGDFYEAFCEAAEIAARTLEITLTKREDSTGSYPMAGIPIDNAASYIETLLDEGYRVAIADQVQDPSETTGVVDRAVTRVVTPGTVLDGELLGAANNYVACLTTEGETKKASVAFLDVSTGEFRVTTGSFDLITDEIDRHGPSEILTGPQVGQVPIDVMHTPFRERSFDLATAREWCEAYISQPSSIFDSDTAIRASGALLAYAEYTQGTEKGGLEYISRIQTYAPKEAMGLDANARRSLELFENRTTGDDHTLLAVIDETQCAMGRRTLTHWLRRPLLDRTAIEKRHDAVEAFSQESLVRVEIRDLLSDVYDIERLITRVSRGRANARDLRSLADTLSHVPTIKETLAAPACECAPLRERRDALDELADVRGRIERAIPADPPIELTDGGVIKAGYDEELDALRSTEREGREWVADLEATERERTSIDSLKVGYNEVHGYYIEVTNPNLDRVPEEYTRRQTLKNAERFYTPDLKQREDEILGAAERADNREYQLFTEVRNAIAAETDRIQQVASVLAEIDVLSTLAHVATERDYVRPEIHSESDSQAIHIDSGRHPVVEKTEETFVPNDTDLACEIAVITGPNMSGKSTYMRQVALIVILAQLGSFIPADRAALPIIDRIFTRIGASDDIAGGRSTFMREMTELSEILHNATGRSLVLLDEVGRGTSTADGRAIAEAVTEFIHDAIGASTLFATHYHELTGIAADRQDIVNLHFTVDRSGREMTFLHSVVRGAASASYGVDVAQLAGVPDPVIERSRELLDSRHERTNGYQNGHHSHDNHHASTDGAADQEQPDLAAAISDLSIAEMTPLEALQTLNELQQRTHDD